MPRRPLLAVASLLSITTLAISGCGGISDEEYIKEVNSSQQKFVEDSQKLGLATPNSTADFKRKLDKLSPLIADLADNLDGLDAPEKAQGENDKLVKTLRDYNELLKKNKPVLVSKNKTEAQTAANTIGQGSSRFGIQFDKSVQRLHKQLDVKPPSPVG